VREHPPAAKIPLGNLELTLPTYQERDPSALQLLRRSADTHGWRAKRS
jgi:hypothetical protein